MALRLKIFKCKHYQIESVMARKRVYRCELSVNERWLFCGRKKAGKDCLKASLLGTRCRYLKISYR